MDENYLATSQENSKLILQFPKSTTLLHINKLFTPSSFKIKIKIINKKIRIAKKISGKSRVSDFLKSCPKVKRFFWFLNVGGSFTLLDHQSKYFSKVFWINLDVSGEFWEANRILWLSGCLIWFMNSRFTIKLLGNF